ncbi:MAG: glycosyltransferase [candidate division Zixibacteria bacterium]|nr:glycosyltransferase [candidate division Zixibacteria bacterium]
MPQRNKNILIVSYFFPPMGLGGVQRAAKTAKYLARDGWNVHVLTCNPDSFPIQDRSMLEDLTDEVEITHIDDPVAKRANLPAEADYILKGKSGLIRRMVQVPDSKKFWADRASKTAEKIVREKSIEHLITTSPPPSAHTIGMHLKRMMDIKWLADFRDPWFADSKKPLTFMHKSMHEKLERNIIQNADSIVGVTSAHVSDLKGKYAEFASKIHHIPNGFDIEDFEGVEQSFPDKLVIAHGGTLCSRHTVEPFFIALTALEDDICGQIEFWQIGAVNEDIYKMIAERFSSTLKIKFMGYKSHTDTLSTLGKASVIVVFGGVDKDSLRIIPAKLYEGLAFKKPLMIVVEKESAVRGVIDDMPGVVHLDPDDRESMKRGLNIIVDSDKSGSLFNEPRGSKLKKYERKYQANQMAELLENA